MNATLANASYVETATSREAERHLPHILVFSAFIGCMISWVIYGLWVLAKQGELKQLVKRVTDAHKASRTKVKKHLSLKCAPDLSRVPDSSRRKKRRSTFIQAFAQKYTFDSSERVHADAKALLARKSPSEGTSGDLRIDRIVGWGTLWWDIPSFTVLPFMTLNVWPRALRIPFHAVGSVLYLGGEVSFRQVRIALLWASLVTVLFIDITKYATSTRGASRKVQRYIQLVSRVFYGALYVFFYRVCETKLYI